MEYVDVWDEVVKRMRSIAGIKKVYEQMVDFDSIPEERQPCIMLESDSIEPTDEEEYDNPGSNVALEDFNLIIIVLFTMRYKQKTVKGKGSGKGVLAWTKAVKDALTADPKHLGMRVRVKLGRTDFMRNIPDKAEKGVVRFVMQEVKLKVFYST